MSVQTGLVPARSQYAHLSGPVPLKTTVVPGSPSAAQKGVRSLAVGVFFALLAGYHGYQRNGGSWGWAIPWAVAGFTLPIVTLPFAISQGFGKRKG